MMQAEDAPKAYAEVLRLLRAADSSGLWPGISTSDEDVVRSSTLLDKGVRGGSFTSGSMPAPLDAPHLNCIFPELSRRAFDLERVLMPGRLPSSTIAVSRHAESPPHIDSVGGAEHRTSLIVALGAYTGGELVVEGALHDIRYKPLEFSGWTHGHWTLPFEGERFSLVWFTPQGCEAAPGFTYTSLLGTRLEVIGSGEGITNGTPLCTSLVREKKGPTLPPSPQLAMGLLTRFSFKPDGTAIYSNLRNGLQLPNLGLGTYQLTGGICEAIVASALSAGFRLIDTASIYKNEEAVGAAVARWEAEEESHRGAVLIGSKCSTYEMGFEQALTACEATLARLGRDSLDLYLIHWPALAKKRHSSADHRRARHDTWRALEALYSAGRVRAIGVSNFTAEHLAQLLEDGVTVQPMVNQVEAHPLFVPQETVDFCRRNGILIQAYSPLGGGPRSNAARATGGEANGTRLLMGHVEVGRIAAEVGRSATQVLLRWGLQSGFCVLPSSSNPKHVAENTQIFDFVLTPAQMAALSALRTEPSAQKFCWDPVSIQ